jgi:membrane protein YqaA with SNARE-associated domain
VPILALFAYAFLSNVALAVVPHEPALLWAGPRLGVWPTALAATAGTVLAALVDHLAFVPLLTRLQARRAGGAATGRIQRWFARAPFAILTLSGLTPLPFFPFKALAFTARYPLGRYCAAVAAGRLPRYLLLAWLGVAVRLPTPLLVAVFVLLLFPTLRMLYDPGSHTGPRRSA